MIIQLLMYFQKNVKNLCVCDTYVQAGGEGNDSDDGKIDRDRIWKIQQRRSITLFYPIYHNIQYWQSSCWLFGFPGPIIPMDVAPIRSPHERASNEKAAEDSADLHNCVEDILRRGRGRDSGNLNRHTQAFAIDSCLKWSRNIHFNCVPDSFVPIRRINRNSSNTHSNLFNR